MGMAARTPHDENRQAEREVMGALSEVIDYDKYELIEPEKDSEN